MPRKRMYNTVRTDHFESKIAHYRALRNYEAASAIEMLARDVGAPVDFEKVEKEVTERRKVYTS